MRCGGVFLALAAIGLSAVLAKAEEPEVSAPWNFPAGTIACDYPVNDDPGYEQAHRDCAARVGSVLSVTDREVSLELPNRQRAMFIRNLNGCYGRATGNECLEAQFIAYNATIGFAIVSLGKLSWRGYVLIDIRSGGMLTFDAQGVFSPSGRYLVVADDNIMDEPEWDIQVFDVAGFEFRRTYEFKAKDHSAWTFVKWQDDKTVIVQKDQYLKQIDPKAPDGPLYRLRLTGGKWTLSKM